VTTKRFKCPSCRASFLVSEVSMPLRCCSNTYLRIDDVPGVAVASDIDLVGRNAALTQERIKLPLKLGCVHQKEERRRVVCKTCRGQTELKILGCSIHGECSVVKPINVVQCCQSCSEYQKYYEPETRNLIYHVAAIDGNAGWWFNCREITKRISRGVFNGRKLIAVAAGEGLLRVDEVRSRFDWGDAEFVEIANDRELREVATFPVLIGRASCWEGATFYAHTKGNSTDGDKVGAVRWRNEMYRQLLDDIPRAMICLRTHAAVGTHKMIWRDKRPPYPSGLKHGGWMFAGTFFWFRNDVIYQRKWQDVPRDRYGAEAWLSGILQWHEGWSVYQPWPEHQYPTPSPYSRDLYPSYLDDNPLNEISVSDWEALTPPARPSIPAISPADWNAVFAPRSPRPKISPTTVLRPPITEGPATVVVIGTYRGGTSFTAQLLTEAGVSMGDSYFDENKPNAVYLSYEDTDFNIAIGDLVRDRKGGDWDCEEWQLVEVLCRERDERHTVWGFKVPSVVFVIDRLLSLVRNPHIVLVTRDLVSTWQSEVHYKVNPSWNNARTHCLSVIDLIEKPRAPTLLIGFERAQKYREHTKDAIRQFLAMDKPHRSTNDSRLDLSRLRAEEERSVD